MFGDKREALRRFYQTAWEKHQSGVTLQGAELIVAQVIEQHPEYHSFIVQESALGKDFSPEDGQTNPFLHMGMHITLAEQLHSDRPAGIRELHQKISQQVGDVHQAEHQMMECLGLILWEAQNANRMPDEQAYLAHLRKLVPTGRPG